MNGEEKLVSQEQFQKKYSKITSLSIPQLNDEHLVAGFMGRSIISVNKEEVLKQLSKKSRETIIEDSIHILKVLLLLK